MGHPRHVLIAFLATLGLLSGAGSAFAEIRSGSATDPVGDSAPPDLTQVSSSFDTGGAWSVTLTFAAPLGAGAPSIYVGITNDTDPAKPCGGNSSAFASFLGHLDPTLTFGPTYDSSAGSSGTGNQHFSADKTQVTYTISDPQIAGFGFRCVFVRPLGASGDSLDSPLYFNGYAPDADGDGVPDSSDLCPTLAGPPPTGCSPPPAPAPTPAPTPTPAPVVTPTSTAPSPTPAKTTKPHCTPPTLKGKTLAAATTALRRAHCFLGKITKPKHTRAGTKLIITKQSRHASTVNVTLAPKRRHSSAPAS